LTPFVPNLVAKRLAKERRCAIGPSTLPSASRLTLYQETASRRTCHQSWHINQCPACITHCIHWKSFISPREQREARKRMAR
jgi:hypothetical protein